MRLMKEIQAAAGACGVTIADGFLDYMMGLTEKMEPYHTSMHLDRLNKQPLEVESIFGEPLLRGQKHGVDLPELISLYEGLRGLDRKIGEKPL